MAVSSSLRFKVLRRDGFKCRYCGAEPEGSQLHIDHVIPRSKGGPDAAWNLLTACAPCNMGKGVLGGDQFVVVDFFWRCIGLGLEDSIETSTALYEVTPTPMQPVSVDKWLERAPSRINILVDSVKRQGSVIREVGRAFTIELQMADVVGDYFDLIDQLHSNGDDPGRGTLLDHFCLGPDLVVCWGQKA